MAEASHECRSKATLMFTADCWDDFDGHFACRNGRLVRRRTDLPVVGHRSQPEANGVGPWCDERRQGLCVGTWSTDFGFDRFRLAGRDQGHVGGTAADGSASLSILRRQAEPRCRRCGGQRGRRRHRRRLGREGHGRCGGMGGGDGNVGRDGSWAARGNRERNGRAEQHVSFHHHPDGRPTAGVVQSM